MEYRKDVGKMTELVIDFRKQSGGHTPVCINGAELEVVQSVKFWGVMINNHLSWSNYADVTVKKAEQHLYSLRRRRKSGTSARILPIFI
eukprot:g30653.t1